MRRHFALPTGVVLTICALVFYYFAVMRIDYARTALFNLDPHPDAIEYFAQAQAMARHHRPLIRLGFDKLPSRYPSGYSVLTLPWLKVLPEPEKILAPFRTNQTLGLLLLLGLFAFYWGRGQPFEGGLAEVLLVTLPAFLAFSRSSISELSAAAGIVLAVALVYLGLSETKRWMIYLAAVVLGLAVNIRIQVIFFGPLLLAMALLPPTRFSAKWLFHCVMAVLLFLLAASPLFVLNYQEFGSPLRTGYDLWVPTTARHHPFFSPYNIRSNLLLLGRELVASHQGFCVANLFGTGTSYVASFIALGLTGVFMMPRDKFFVCALLGGISFFVAAISFYFVDIRFYLPLLILLALAAALPVQWAVRCFRCHPLRAFLIFILFVLACLGFPSAAGYPAVAYRAQAWMALKSPVTANRALHFEAAECLGLSCAERPGVVLSDIDAAYLNALLGERFAAAPIDGKHHYAGNLTWHYGKQEAEAMVRQALTRRTPVYALFSMPRDRDQNLARLPIIENYRWLPVPHPPPSIAAILKLTPSPLN